MIVKFLKTAIVQYYSVIWGYVRPYKFYILLQSGGLRIFGLFGWNFKAQNV